jgi:tape measure domain-containing protein
MRVATLSALVTVEGASQAGADLDGFSKKLTGVTGAADKMATALGLAGAAAGAYAMGRSALDAAAKMEALQQALKANTSGTAELQQVTRDLANIAKLPAINLEQAYMGFIQLKAAKLSTQEAEQGLMGIAKAAAAVAATPDQFGRAINGIQQIANSTKPLQEDINILRDSLPNATMLLDKAFGKTRAEDIAAMGLSGKEVAMRFIQIANTVPAVSGGIGNMIVNMEDSFRQLNESVGRLVAKFLEAFGPRIQEAVGKLTDLFDRLSKNGQQVDQIMRIAFTFLVGSVVAGAIKNVAIMTEAFVTLRKAIQSVALAEVLAFAIANPAKAIAGVVAAVGIITAANIGINKMMDSMFGKGGSKPTPVQIPGGGTPTLPAIPGTGGTGAPTGGAGQSRGGGIVQILAGLAAGLASMPALPGASKSVDILGKIEANTKTTADALQLRRQTLGGGPIGAYGVTAAEMSGQANLRFGDFSASGLIPGGIDLERSVRRIIRDETRKTGLPGNIRRF